MNPLISNLEKMLEQSQDNALLRFGLGNAYFAEKNYTKAVQHLKEAVSFDPGYSAAWKLYGRSLQELGEFEQAQNIFQQGIQQAEKKGDLQAIKEMQVFSRRINKQVRK